MRAAVVLLALALAAPVARAAERATRWDLARSLMAFDRALLAAAPEGERLAEVNRAFDRLTLDFFAGRSGPALRSLDALTADLAGVPRCAIRVRIVPPVVVRGGGSAPLLRWTPLHDHAGSGAITLRFLGADGVPAGGIRLPEESGETSLPPFALALPAGDYDVRASREGTSAESVARFSVLARPLAEARAEVDAALAAVDAKDEATRQAVASVRARSRLLTDSPSPVFTTLLLEPPHRLAGEVLSEAAALAAGRNPFRRRVGDVWRVLDAGGAGMPLRLHAPPAAAGDDPLPLVIALHGAGGDENMFLFSYGAGLLRDLARSRGFLAVCPATTAFSTGPEVLDRLLPTLSGEYAVDPDRVYLLGHSLGAGAAAIAARARPDRIAACVLMAGGGFGAPGDVPVRIYAGALDALMPSPAPGPGVRLFPEHGHTLLVAAALPEAIDWLLAQRRGKREK